MRIVKGAAAAAMILGIAHLAFAAGDHGTPEEAQAMLAKAIAALTADKPGTLAAITKGESGGFRDRDLYVYCGDAAGLITAHGASPDLVGTSLKEIKDKVGAPLGDMIYSAAQEGVVAEVAYMWPRPNEEQPSQKVAFVTKASDEICAVGYYK